MDRRFIRIFAAALLTVMIFAGFSRDSARAEAPHRKLTVMVYAIGTDLESTIDGGGYASSYIIQMIRSAFSREDINVVLFTGGAKRWATGYPVDCNTIQIIDDSPRTREIYRFPNLRNMGDGDTLAYFLNYCVEQYPADDYALVVFDHGGGPVSGVCFDEMFLFDSILNGELRDALEQSPFGEEKRMKWIYFATCLTGSAEIAAICAPYADYMFASEEPGYTAAYPFSFLPGAENRSGDEIGQVIADAFYDKAEATNEELETAEHINTMAVYNLRGMSILQERLDALFAAILSDLDEDTYKLVARVVAASEEVYSRADQALDLRDLRSLVMGFSVYFPEECTAVIEALDDVVIYSKSSNPNETGMSIYHPFTNKKLYQMMGSKATKDSRLSSNYAEYTDRFFALMQSVPQAEYPTVKTYQDIFLELEKTSVILPLSSAQADNFHFAELLILEDTGTTGMYRLIARNPVAPDENGTLNTETTNEGLYVLNGDGQPVTDALEYRMIGDTIELRGVLEAESGHRAMALADIDAIDLAADTAETINIRIRCRRQEDGTLRILNIEHVYDEPGPVDGTLIDLSNYDYLYLLTTPRKMTAAEDGTILPYDEWSDGGITSYRYTIDLSDDWSLAFVDDHLTWIGRSAMLVVTDLQGNGYVTDWVALGNPANETLPMTEELLYEDETCAITADQAWINTDNGQASLFIRYRLTNRSDAPITFTASEFMADGYPLNRKEELLGTVEAGQTATAVTLIRATESPINLADVGILSLTFASIDESGFGLWAPSEITLR